MASPNDFLFSTEWRVPFAGIYQVMRGEWKKGLQKQHASNLFDLIQN